MYIVYLCLNALNHELNLCTCSSVEPMLEFIVIMNSLVALLYVNSDLLVVFRVLIRICYTPSIKGWVTAPQIQSQLQGSNHSQGAHRGQRSAKECAACTYTMNEQF